MVTSNAINLRTAGVPTYDGAGTFAASALTQHSTLIGGAANLIVSLGVATNGQLVIGSTGAQPVLATLTGGTGVGIVNAAGSITINSTGGGISWTDVAGVAQAMVVNNAYTANNAGLVTLTLPATAVYGSVFRVVGKGAGGWKIGQNAGQTIRFGSVSSTAGAAGYLASTNQYDAVEIVTSVADTDFTIISSIGNITVA